MQIEDSISYILAKLTVSHRNLIERSVNEIGLHSGQVFVLMELWKQDHQRQVDLAEKLNIAPATINKTITGLIDKKFVGRERYEDDARSTRIFLTERGKSVKESLEKRWQDIEEQTVMGMTSTEALILKQLLAKMMGVDMA